MSVPFVLCEKKNKLISDGGDSASKKHKRVCGGILVESGEVCVKQETRVRLSVLFWCV